VSALIEYRRVDFAQLDLWLDQGWLPVRDQHGRIKTEIVQLDREVAVVYRAYEEGEAA